MMIIYLFSFMMSSLMFTLKRKYILLMLLSLEFMIISLYMMLFLMLNLSVNMYMSLIFMVMSVCEGVLGLSLLVSMIRGYGNDYYQSFSILW